MSAPRTNVKKQKRRHRAPLIGVGLVVLFGFLMFLFYTFNAFEDAPGLDDSESEINMPAPATSEEDAAVDVTDDGQSDASDGGDAATE